jgi:phosphoesterase RecJ-like protein
MDRELLNAIARHIERALRILVVAHVAPDGDAIGSMLGLGRLLEAQGKMVTLACEDPVPDDMKYLPGSEHIVPSVNGWYDLVISLDCSDRRRIGNLLDAPPAQASHHDLASVPLINIDHHVTNVLFGTVNWVDPDSVATAQMVLALADAMRWQLDAETATCLLNGIVTDTRSFRTGNVDESAMAAVLRLMRAGASLPHVARQALDLRPLATVRLWGDAVVRLQLEEVTGYPSGGILWTEVTREMRRDRGVAEKDVSGLANFLSGVREAGVVLVFTERDNDEIDVSMRAAPGIDVSAVALSLGGGGHPRAAGTTLCGPLREIRERVLSAVRLSLAEQVTAARVPQAARG